MLKKRMLSILTITALVATLLAGCGGDPASSGETSSGGTTSNGDEVYTIRIASTMDTTYPQVVGITYFAEELEKLVGDRVDVVYVGGPEAIPAFNQGEAIQNGSIDMSWNNASYYAEMVPEALALNFSEKTYEEEKENGAIEYLSQFHQEKLNAVLLARSVEHMMGYFYMAKGIEVKSSADLAGLTIRGTGCYVPSIEAVGAEALALDAGEFYTSLEKGIIDGIGWPTVSISATGCLDVLGSVITPPIYIVDCVVIANQDFWNGLPADIQDAINQALDACYERATEFADNMRMQEEAELAEYGVETVVLEDAEEYEEKCKEANWTWLAQRGVDTETLETYFRN